jgi:hypothetical protein
MGALSLIPQAAAVIITILLAFLVTFIGYTAVFSMFFTPIFIALEWSFSGLDGPTGVRIIPAANILVLSSYLSLHGLSQVVVNEYTNMNTILNNVVYGHEILFVLLVWAGVVVSQHTRPQQTIA